MKMRFLLAGACALATWLNVLAAPVAADDAQLVTRGWDLSNRQAFGALGEVKQVNVEKDADGNVLWYVVVTENGAAVVAPDDEIEPIIAVVPGCDGTIPEGSPLRAMLMLDVRRRIANVAEASKLKLASPVPVAPSATATKWKKLKSTATMKMLAKGANPATVVAWLDGWNSSDTKVVSGKRVQSLRFWNQTGSSKYFTNGQIFNLYTPEHNTCGCVATAGAAIMHYFRAPLGNEIERECTLGPEQATINLTTKGGDYDWSLIDNLTLHYGSPQALGPEALDLLARVAYDCGVGCCMAYNIDGHTSSGSNTYMLRQSFSDVFNVVNAQLVTRGGLTYGYGKSSDIGHYDQIIYNQIRGGAPVAMGINGHEVVATGYGIDSDETDYCYVFLGWGGYNDAWYALPTIDCKATVDGGDYVSDYIDEVITEIAFDDKYIPIVGRIRDFDESAVAGGIVEIHAADDTLIESLTTDANGYFGTRIALPAGNGGYVVDPRGNKYPFTVGTTAQTTTQYGAVRSGDLASDLPKPFDVVMPNPCVRVEGEEFSTLNEAFNYAAELSSADPVVVEVFAEAILMKHDYTIAFDCIIRSNAGATNVIKRVNGAGLIIDTGCTVAFENVQFAANGNTMLTVRPSATAILDGDVAIEAIKLDDGASLQVKGLLNPENGYQIDAPGAMGRGEIFATYDGDLADIADLADRFANVYDIDLRGRAVETETGVALKWEVAKMPVDLAVAVLAQNDDEVSFDNLNTLFRLMDQTTDAEIRILKTKDNAARDLTMTNWVSVAGRTLTILAPNDPVTIKGDGDPGDGGFAVSGGGRLIVSNVVFSAYAKKNMPFISVTDGGAVVFKRNAGLERIHVSMQRGVTPLYKTLSPVCVEQGALTLQRGSFIHNCTVKKSGSNEGLEFLGGAVYLNGEGATLDLAGEISGCKAEDGATGGGVYAKLGAKVYVSDWASVTGNKVLVNNKETDNDILVRTNDAIVVKAPLKAQKIGVKHSVFADAKTGKQFAVLAEDARLTDDERARAAQVFVNNSNATYGAVANADGTFTWGAANTYHEPEPCDPEDDPDPGPDPVPVICQPFAFTSITEQEDGSWKLTLAPATTYCTYTLKTSDDLQTWTPVGDAKTLQPGDDFEFTVDGGDAKRFWLVTGEDGVEP